MAAAYARCTCGAKVEVDAEEYGEGYVGVFRDSCEPCRILAEEEAELQIGLAEAYGPEEPHWNSGWDY